jgi:hypothetical protein
MLIAVASIWGGSFAFICLLTWLELRQDHDAES